MRLLRSAFFLFVACYGLDEEQIPDELKKNFDKDKLIIPVSHQFGEALYTNITIRAFTAIMHSLAEERMEKLPSKSKIKMQKCLKSARDLTGKAKCIVALMEKLRSMKMRNRNIPLRRIEIQAIRRRRQKRWVAPDMEKYSQSDGMRSFVVSKGSYQLLQEKGSTLPEIFAFHMRKTAAHLRGLTTLPLRGWRSLARDLAFRRKKVAARDHITSALSSGITASIGSLTANESSLSEVSRNQDKSALHQLNALISEGVGLAARASGYDTSNKSIRILSPRIGDHKSIHGETSVLSPDVVFQRSEMDAEKNALLELLMETSGTTYGMKKALEQMEKSDRMLAKDDVQMTRDDVEETLGKKERLKIDVIQKMERTYNSEQMDSFKKRGFAFMTTRQRRLVYGSTSPFHVESIGRRTNGMSAAHLERRLINLIRLQALGNSAYSRRMKIDLIASPTVASNFNGVPLFNVNSIFSPVILSTFVSSPTLIGPLILSPWLFSTLIASPWALCPIILSPFTFVPIILSPVTMSPFVLSPGIFSPALLSPLLMVPYILSPGVFNPLILSPLVLSPLVLSPSFGSPVILSPALLAPLVFSPLHHSSLILSPSLLSPAIGSDGQGSMIILSPDLGAT